MMRFKKVKWDQKAITLIWTTESGTETHEHDLTSKQAPHADLDEALQDLAADVVNVCEMDIDLDSLRVQSVSLSFSEKTGIRGAVVTALKPVKIASSPVVLNTPHLTESGENDKGVMPPSMWRRVVRIEDEARAYLDGKRAPNPQRDMFGSTTVSFGGTSVTITPETAARGLANIDAILGESHTSD